MPTTEGLERVEPPDKKRERPGSRSRTGLLVAGLAVWAVAASAGLGWMAYQNSLQGMNADAVFLNRVGDGLRWASLYIQESVYWKNASWGDSALGWLYETEALAKSGGGAPDGGSLVGALNLTQSNFDCAGHGLGLDFAFLRENASNWASSSAVTYLQLASGVLGNLSVPLLAVTPNGINPMTQIGPATVGQIRQQAGDFYTLQTEYSQSRC